MEELVLRFASLFRNPENIKEILSFHMTEYMRDVIKNDSFDYSIEQLFERIIKILKPLGKSVFRFNNGSFSTSLYDAITIGVAENIDYYETDGLTTLSDRINQLKADPEFRKYTGSASNSKSRVTNRIQISKKIFKVE